MAALPTGTVSFLFTDVESSTRHAESLGDEGWADVLEAQRAHLRDAIDRHGGVEFGTEGDAVFAAFTRAADAVAAAAEAQRALTADDRVRVRIGIHTGEALVRDGNYVGHALHLAKRVCDAGHGGQIIVSSATAEVVRGHLPADLRLRDMGAHRLKDLGEPQRLHVVDGPGLPVGFPPLRTLEAHAHNLPAQRSTFIGRADEMRDVGHLLDGHRIVALTGVGGCGKTRLALHAAAERLDRHPDGVFFVDLAPIADPDLIATTIAASLGVRDTITGGGAPLAERSIASFLTERCCLLVFDNCEHLLDECADWVDRVLETSPRSTVLATSRESLQVDGEQTYRVPSLSVPDQAHGAGSDAVALFVDRATAVDPQFELSERNADAVAEITRRLDGIPLAIEFAASRVSHLTPRQISERLDDMFRLLTGGRRRVQRQQTLRAALDWSHDLLEPREQILLRRLAVFVGSAALDAIEAVCAGSGVERDEIVDLLGSLVGKSLVTVVADGDRVRYRLLETVRLYAEEKLRESGESDAIRTRHCDHVATWIRSIPLVRLFFDYFTRLDLERDLDNIRAAVAWSLDRGARIEVLRMASSILSLWTAGGQAPEGQRWLEAAADDIGELAPEERVMAYNALVITTLLVGIGDLPRWVRLGLDAVPGHVTGPAALLHGFAANAISVRAQATGSADDAAMSRRLAQAGVAIADQLIDPAWAGWARQSLGHVEIVLGEIDAAGDAYASSTERWSATKLPYFDPVASYGCFIARLICGRLDEAREVVALMGALEERRLRIVETARRSWWIADSKALMHAADHDAGRSRAALQEMIDVATQAPARPADGILTTAATVAMLLDDHERASTLLAAAAVSDDRPGRLFFSRSPMGYALYRWCRDGVRAALPREVARQSRARGMSMSTVEAIQFARDG